MGFMEKFSKENTNNVQKASMIVGFTSFLCCFLFIDEDVTGILSFIALISSILTFYLFKK